MSAAPSGHASPKDPIAAVTHRDPYPYYADLVANRPLYRDDALGLWVASSAEAVTAVMSSDLCGVRPAMEPVPEVLLGSPAADIFRHLIRMNDGPGHGPLNQAIGTALRSFDASRVIESSRTCAAFIYDDETVPARDPVGTTDFALRLPVYVIGNLLGLPAGKLRETAAWIGDFVHCLAPTSKPEQIAHGKRAAAHLLNLFRALLAAPATTKDQDLLAVFVQEAGGAGRVDADVIAANAIGLLAQTYEATAGLIGNTLLALARYDDVRARVSTDPELLAHVIREVLRYDPPVQNTRRFLHRDRTVAGQAMKAGDAVLVVLAAANRDPAANPQPDRFDLYRENPRLCTFGVGTHACPGHRLAAIMARHAVEHLMASEVDLDRLRRTVNYRPSANVRVPLFTDKGAT